MFPVEVGRAEDLDRVDVGIGEQVGQIGVTPGHPPLPGPALEHLLAWITQRHHVAPLVLEVAGHVEGRDVADTDDAQPHPIHGPLPYGNGSP